MLVMTTLIYPPAMADQVGQKYIEIMDKYPDDASIAESLVPAAVKATAEGIKVTAIYSAKENKIKETMDLASNRMLEFRKIEGFRYSIDIAYDAVEAMALLGLEAP